MVPLGTQRCSYALHAVFKPYYTLAQQQKTCIKTKYCALFWNMKETKKDGDGVVC